MSSQKNILLVVLPLLFAFSCKTTRDNDMKQTVIVSDGKTDASAMIMKALETTPSLVLEKDKVFLIKQPLLLKSGQTLNLNGSTLLFDYQNPDVGIDILDEEGIEIRNGIIERKIRKGQTAQKRAFRANSFKASISGIYCNSDNNTFQDLVFENWMTGLRLSNFSTSSKDYVGLRKNNKITNCKFHGNYFGILIKGQSHAELTNIEGDYGTEILGINNQAPPHLIYVAGTKSSNSTNTNLKIENISCSDSHSSLDMYGSCITISNVVNSTLRNVYVNNCDGGLTIGTANNLTIENVTMEDMKKSCIKTRENTRQIHIKKVNITQTGFSKNAIAINGNNFVLEDINIKYGNQKCSKLHYTLSVRGKNNTVENISFENCRQGCKYIILDKSSTNNKIVNIRRTDGDIVDKKFFIKNKGSKNVY